MFVVPAGQCLVLPVQSVFELIEKYFKRIWSTYMSVSYIN